MSSEKGNTARRRAQKHQNSRVFKNDLHDKSALTKFLNSVEISDVCSRCKSVLEWRIKYKKYKVSSKPKTCVKCKGKKVTLSYRVMCSDCAQQLKLCPKCGLTEEEALKEGRVPPQIHSDESSAED